MHKKIKTFYLIHHSHTDIGYTDLQENVVDNHINNIRQADIQAGGNPSQRSHYQAVPRSSQNYL